jgi:hypothetical protein
VWTSSEWRIPAKSAIANQLMAKWISSLPPALVGSSNSAL